MPQLLNSTIGDWMDHMAATHPDGAALAYHEPSLHLTWRELNEVCRRMAKGLLASGIKKGDHVAIWATNLPEWVYTVYATAKIGAVLVTVNTNYRIFELEYLLRQSDSKLLLYARGVKDNDYRTIISELLPDIAQGERIQSERLPVLEQVVYIPHVGEAADAPCTDMFATLMARGESVSDDELNAVQASIDEHDVVNMQYTSGTTGFPKGVMLTHHNILNNGYFIGENMKLTPNDRLCIPVPFFHCFGLVLAQMACITHGTTMVPVEVYSPTEVMKTVQAERCTALHGVPTMFIFILSHKDFAHYDLSTLRTGIMAGSTCPMEVMREVMDKLHMRDIVITYGQTESSPGITMSQTDDPVELRVSTVGRLLPHCEGKIVDPETGKTLPPNTQGEICTRGYHIMRGYYNMAEATAQAIDDDGWLHTGDLGTVDENGYYAITGRIRDMIIRGGENIYPREIEELVYLHPSVSDVQVVAVPSQRFGEEVCAFVIAKEGAQCCAEDVKAFVAQRMSRHKVPSHVLFTEAFPMTASGKIQKYKLREMACEELGL